MDKALLKKIVDSMDKAMYDFLENEESIFKNDRETLIFKYKSLPPLNKWKRKQTCIVGGCKNKSIERSHTIQNSGSIERIAEKGHVLTPRLNLDTGEIELFSVGVKNASTFPGYCSEHERIFESFENIKDFQTGEHLGLQLYRTVCREIVIAENQIKTINQLVKDYKAFRDKKVSEVFIENIGIENIQSENIDIKSL